MTQQRTKTFMHHKGNEWGIMYIAGGNPPIAAGLFDQNGNRLAWWPASIEPSQENGERVIVELVLKREDDAQIITRQQIRNLFEQISGEQA